MAVIEPTENAALCLCTYCPSTMPFNNLLLITCLLHAWHAQWGTAVPSDSNNCSKVPGIPLRIRHPHLTVPLLSPFPVRPRSHVPQLAGEASGSQLSRWFNASFLVPLLWVGFPFVSGRYPEEQRQPHPSVTSVSLSLALGEVPPGQGQLILSLVSSHSG